MPFGDLSGQFISQSFQVLVQADTTQNPVTFADGLGNDIGIMTNAQTSSFLTELPSGVLSSSANFVTNAQTSSFLTSSPFSAISITGSFTLSSGSFSTRVSNLEANPVFTATAISGAFNGQTGSFLTELPAGVISSSLGFVKAVNSVTPDPDGEIDLNTSEIQEHSSALYYTDARVKTKLNAENVISSSMIVATASFVATINGGSF